MIKSPVFWTVNPLLELALTFKLESKVWKTKILPRTRKECVAGLIKFNFIYSEDDLRKLVQVVNETVVV